MNLVPPRCEATELTSAPLCSLLYSCPGHVLGIVAAKWVNPVFDGNPKTAGFLALSDQLSHPGFPTLLGIVEVVPLRLLEHSSQGTRPCALFFFLQTKYV